MSRTQVTVTTIRAAQAGDADAMWQIIDAMDGLLRDAVRKAAPDVRGEDAEDLLQDARAALIMHVREYDTEAEAALSTYVYRPVRRAVTEAYISMTSALTVDATTALRVRQALAEHNDVEAAWDAIKDRTWGGRGLTKGRFMAAVEAMRHTTSVDAPVGDDEDGLTLADVLPDTSADVTVELERQEKRRYCRWLMTQIPQRQAYALRAEHGIQMMPRTPIEIREDLGVTAGNLRQLRHAGLASARKVDAAQNALRDSETPLQQVA
ncbi:sigma-70 family RNA polymerase sigma factor [Streptomyces sp. CBG33]|uniref:sigma-70 family RNA polymerase sigma factor n=1 Tax=Streptomyces sp. CBG33 TaxID=2762624 RepID=UPI001644F668|nr:sigma-70 family RNA polymerase sigma factor [Streptomyces sp. CBG33]